LYFDERPKERLEDFYDRERELQLLLTALKEKKSLILVLGLRRSGKTSLLQTGLGLSGIPYVIVDARELVYLTRASYADLLTMLEEAFRKSAWKKSLIEYLKGIKGITIQGLEIRFEWAKEKRISLKELLSRLNEFAEKRGTNFVVAFDEAQLLSRVVLVNFPMLLAHAYDYLKNLTFVLTGSEVGLLYEFLDINNPEAPLFGRHRVEIKLERFEEEKARDFLQKGFEQAGVRASDEIINYAIEKLDGIVGWLTEFGARALKQGLSTRVVDQVMEEGSKLALQELEHFLNYRAMARKRYLLILRGLAGRPMGWAELKKFVEREQGGPIYSKNFSDLLNNLVKSGFVECQEGKYMVSDPVLRFALSRM